MDFVGRHESHLGAGGYVEGLGGPELVALTEEGEEEGDFGQGEGVADALMFAEGEREEGVSRPGCIGGETLGIEAIGGWPKGGHAVGSEDGEEKCFAAANRIVSEAIVFAADPAHGVNRWVEAEGFLDDLRGVGEARHVFPFRGASHEDLVDFGMPANRDIGMVGKAVKRPGESGGGGFESGGEEGLGFVEQGLPRQGSSRLWIAGSE